MKAISIRQPWADLILYGGKDVENREWACSYRGWLLIHASKGCTEEEYYDAVFFCAARNLPMPPPHEELRRGGIVGMVYMKGCVDRSDSPWFVGTYGFLLDNPQPMPFIQYRGSRGLFDVPESVLDQHWQRTSSSQPRVYVDPIHDWGDMVKGDPRKHGTKWCHMFADTEEALHRMARRIGLRREWYQGHKWPHYDLTPGKRMQAIKAGAVELSVNEAVAFWNEKGW